MLLLIIARVTAKSAGILLSPLLHLLPLLLQTLRRYRQAGFHLLGKQRHPEFLQHPLILEGLTTQSHQTGY